MSSGLYSHTTRGIGTVLTAAIYNSDHNNHIINANPSQHGGYSDSVSEMQITSDPGGVGSEVLATNLAGELAQLRFAIKRIAGTAEWYQAPVTSLALIGGGIPLTLAFASTPLTLRRTENDTTPREILSLGSGSGVGNKFAVQIVGSGSNAAAELRVLLAATEIMRFSGTLLTHFIAHEFRNYVDVKEIAAPGTPGADTARMYAKDVSGITKMFVKDSAGVESLIGGEKWAHSYADTTAFSSYNAVIPLDDTVPLSSEGAQILTTSITLNKAGNRVKVNFSILLGVTISTRISAAIFRGTTCIGVVGQSIVGTAIINNMNGHVEDIPGTVGPHVYSIRLGSSELTYGDESLPIYMYINGLSAGRRYGGAGRSTLSVMEMPS